MSACYLCDDDTRNVYEYTGKPIGSSYGYLSTPKTWSAPICLTCCRIYNFSCATNTNNGEGLEQLAPLAYGELLRRGLKL